MTTIDILPVVDIPLPAIPDDLSIPQFFLDRRSAVPRPARPADVPCLIDDTTGRKVLFDELLHRSQALANALATLYSIGEDDVVLLYGRNNIDYPVAIWAAHRVGAIVSPANPDYAANELEYQLKAAKAKLIISHPEAVDVASAAAASVGLPQDKILVFDIPGQAPARASPYVSLESLIQHGLKETNVVERGLRPGEGRTKLAFLSFSSGTTGTPKAVAIPHYAVIANVVQLGAANRLNEDYASWNDRRFRTGDVAIGVLPLYHIYGLVINLHFMLYAAMTVVIISRFNFESMLKSIVKYRISHLFIVPPQAVLLCKHPSVKNYDLGSVRALMTGAAPLSDELAVMLHKLFPDAHIGQGYGMTETSTAVSLWPLDSKRGKSGSAGHLLPGVVARIVKEDGTYGARGEAGELVVKSPSNALCYYNNKEATEETFLEGGFVRTGDEAKITEEGDLFIIDRLKEIMKVRGFQVAPAELEGTLLQHADVADTCVVGVPDEFSGEVPLAFVVLSADAAKRVADGTSQIDAIRASIIKYIADNKIGYKHLAGGVEFIDAIPKNPSGKLLRRVLREKAKAMRGTIKARL
ncbi:unnamed protein product [Mycena citricolor]|uniref:Phenylacetyl-CoA ligase n=1 Tax=Mycena citricolor TaxID=2018698 RepID=A0AAD2H6M3_9AGAR|nr:unnamed protein product [Mycena citricolor]CAK5271874.1 unnamed protein product [Mycena citricolor]